MRALRRLDFDIEAELARFQRRRVKHRSEGRHLSDVIHYIMTKLEPGRFGNRGRGVEPLEVHTGFVWEDVMSWALARHFGLQQRELEQDGIFITLDGFDTKTWRTREAKSTKISAANPITGERFWHWHVQIMGGLHAMDAEQCELTVLHVNGAYELGGGRFGRTVATPWLMTYTKREIVDNWRMILRARDRMEEEGI